MAEGRILVLGVSAAAATAAADNAYLVFDSPGGLLLIDCAGSPAHKLLRAGLDPDELAGVLLTHDHADHLYGLPSLAQHLSLIGRRAPLPLYGLEPTLATARALLRSLHVDYDFFAYCPFPRRERQPVVETGAYTVYASPTRHSRPSVGVRIEFGSAAMAYSSDTEPCPAVERLAQGVDLLIHECAASEPQKGHSTPEQVAQVAGAAGAGRLILIHYDEWLRDRFEEVQMRFARYYGRPVALALEGDVYAF